MDARQIQLYERMAGVETNINTILTNHLPHIHEEIKDLRTETEAGLNGLGTRFEESMKTQSQEFKENLKTHSDKLEKRQDGVDKKFWAIILLLVSSLVGIVTSNLF